MPLLLQNCLTLFMCQPLEFLMFKQFIRFSPLVRGYHNEIVRVCSEVRCAQGGSHFAEIDCV